MMSSVAQVVPAVVAETMARSADDLGSDTARQAASIEQLREFRQQPAMLERLDGAIVTAEAHVAED
jgi:hypothetical protein